MLTDLERVKRLGKGRVDLTIGSALDIFGGAVPYRDVVAWQRQQEQEEAETRQ
jgi:phosphoribosylformimino-5-aminoimidazole carboxamide ribotide isomerase